MDPKEENKEIQPPIPPKPQEETGPIIHTYEDDLAHAMNATDANVVQQLLATAREKDADKKEEVKNNKQRSWFMTGSIILLLFAIGATGYGIYHYKNLTVPVSQTVPVGVFPTVKPVIIGTTTIEEVVASLKADTTLSEKRPYVVPLVLDETTLLPLSKKEFFEFIQSDASEPFVASLDSVRLGVVNKGDTIETFIITSTTDPERATKEFLIAEKDLVSYFHKALAIPSENIPKEIGDSFSGEHIYNLPVRIQSYNTTEESKDILLLYGYATEKVIVVTRDPEILKMVYDTVIRQR